MTWAVTALATLLLAVPCFGGDEPPPSPSRPWFPPELDAYEKALAQSKTGPTPGTAEIAIDPERIYDLPGLVGQAGAAAWQARSQALRVGERACQAAAAVGLSRSAYFPSLVETAG